MTEPVDATTPGGTIDTNYIPPPPSPHSPGAWELADQPDYTPPKPPSRIKEILLPAIICTAIGAAVTAAALHYTAAPVATPPPVQALAATPVAPQETEDQNYLRNLAEHGISSQGVTATTHIFKAYGHQICYAFSPPGPQPYDQVVNAVLAQQVDLIKVAGYTLAAFTHEDAQNMVEAALDSYCPELRPG